LAVKIKTNNNEKACVIYNTECFLDSIIFTKNELGNWKVLTVSLYPVPRLLVKGLNFLITSSRGYYSITNINAGRINLIISYVGSVEIGAAVKTINEATLQMMQL
jgi:hypothetical protein